MPMSPTRDLRPNSPVAATDPGPRIRPTSTWLWVALVVAFFAVALAWLHHQRSAPTAAPVGQRALPEPGRDARPVQVTPANERATPAQGTRAAALPQNRDARPLAGNAAPSYPAQALRSGAEGSVLARLQVGADGKVNDVSIVRRDGVRDRNLDRAVIDATRQWRFEPAMRDGQAVASVVQVPVDFRTRR